MVGPSKVLAVALMLHSAPIAPSGLNSLSANTNCARTKYMSFAELWPESGWK